MTTIPQIITPNSITVVVNGKSLVAKASHPNFSAIRDFLKAGRTDTAKLAALFDIPQAISTRTNGRVTVSKDGVLYDGKPLHNSLTNRMVGMLSEGFNIDPLARFLDKLMQNPSKRAVDGLYDFLAAANIPITPEGDFLAYKKVRSTYFDIHSNTMRNAPGDTLRVKRNQVDEDPDRTCSHGLHVCSESYLSHFGSSGGDDRVVIVQVNPADVVAIPRDYNNAKMRVCGYTVVGEVDPNTAGKAFTSTVMASNNFAAQPANTPNTRLAYEVTDVVKNVNGVVVRFVREDGEWFAEWTDSEGGEQSEHMWNAKTLDGAVTHFVEDYMEEIESWTAEIRWIDDDGDFRSKTVTFAWPTEDGEPDEDDLSTAPEIDDDNDLPYDHLRIVNITRVPNSVRWRLAE